MGFLKTENRLFSEDEVKKIFPTKKEHLNPNFYDERSFPQESEPSSSTQHQQHTDQIWFVFFFL